MPRRNRSGATSNRYRSASKPAPEPSEPTFNELAARLVAAGVRGPQILDPGPTQRFRNNKRRTA